MAKQTFKRGDIVQFSFPNEPVQAKLYKISATAPENGLSSDRVDVCEKNNKKAFKEKRGIGMPVKYLKKVLTNRR